MPLLVLLAGCTAPDTDPIDVPRGPPTDTFPSFYGEVPKNLLMVSVDTFRRDLLLRYGGVSYIPVLDEMMEQGVVLDRHHSCSNWTFSSVLCAMQGATNLDDAYVPDLHNPDDAMAPDDYPTLPGRLSAAGWRTMLVTSNSWFSADHNSDVGFDQAERPEDRRTSSVAAAGLQAVLDAKEGGANRWYLHLHVKEPHASYSPPDEYLAGLDGLEEIPWDLSSSDEQYQTLNQWSGFTAEEQELLLAHLLVRYHGEVNWMGDQLREALVAYGNAGLLDDTLVVFWNDHGEQFFEHGQQTHAYGLNREENDGFAFFWAENIVPAVWDEPTSHIDLAPTLLTLWDVPLDEQVTGMPVGTAPSDRVLDFLTVARLGVVQAVLQNDWKLIYRWETGERELYDTRNDPLELDNVWAADEPHAVELEPILQDRVRTMEPLTTRFTPE